MRRVILLGFLLAFSTVLLAQNSSTSTASVSATIIQPVGTGKIENAPTGNSQPGAITIVDLKKLGSFRIFNQGYVFDLYISEDTKVQELKPGNLSRNIIVHFN